MNEAKPWLETWHPGDPLILRKVERHYAVVPIADVAGQALAVTHETFCTRGAIEAANAALPARARLIAAAPKLVRALLKTEWGAGRDGYEWGYECSGCRRTKALGHEQPFCFVDAALNEAGLDTADKRDAARADIAALEASRCT